MNKTLKIAFAAAFIGLSGYGIGRAQDTLAQVSIGEPTRNKYDSWLHAMDYSPNGQYVAAGGDARKLVVWDTRTGEKVRDMGTFKRNIALLAWSPDNSLIAVASLDDSLKIFDVTTGHLLKEIEAKGAVPFFLQFSPDGKSLTYASNDGAVTIVPIKHG